MPEETRIALGQKTNIASPSFLQDAHFRRALLYTKLKQYALAEADIVAGYAIKARSMNKMSLPAEIGYEFWLAGERDRAKKIWDIVWKEDPHNVPSRVFLAHYLTCYPEDTGRNEKMGLHFAQEAYELAPKKDRTLVTTLAMAKAANNDFSEAIALEKEALAIPEQPIRDSSMVSEAKIGERIALYEKGQPWRMKTVK